ncbi:MAG: AraC family transcriptional regulator [Mesosutterella sp.]|nr:AraC family transcriptional regulator [Mesosutterella sp.]
MTESAVSPKIRAMLQILGRMDFGSEAVATKASPVPGLSVYRAENSNTLGSSLGYVSFSVVVQGEKMTTVGDRVYRYREGECLVCGAAVPSTFHAVGASAGRPFYAASLALDPQMLADFGRSEDLQPPPLSVGSGVFVFQSGERLLDATLRLLELIERPGDIRALAPIYSREIHYLLTRSECGPQLRSLLTAGTRSHAVYTALSWLRGSFTREHKVEEIAERVHMSPSAFRRQFKSVTGLSPLQYVKRLRLYEAQRLLMAGRANVSSAAYEVGYESPTQFVREYKRLFGQPPLRDVKKRIAAGA